MDRVVCVVEIMSDVKDDSEPIEFLNTSSSIWKVVNDLELSFAIRRKSASCRRCSSIRAERME